MRSIMNNTIKLKPQTGFVDVDNLDPIEVEIVEMLSMEYEHDPNFPLNEYKVEVILKGYVVRNPPRKNSYWKK